ncbi:TetR/AcrR family transcriptional regulator [Nonomuraea sp. FMUSA5-5]|uniref:TetR/AcrR family transcriptional regulator n=1 Tax=Nonomuraea composti TaxID=2720023 RepID=A0ABX1BB94_9ACTN|nr:TetR/AcrR family transcriptional regulator [Nonomuraea sp. FMUSA5-5]
MRAAQQSFAERGYTATTIRGVATAADVDPALVLQFFGSKDGLFDAALRVDPPTRSLLTLVHESDADVLGERLLRRYLELWETPGTGARLLAVVRGSAASPSASAMVAAFMSEEVMLPLARAIGADHAELRANLTGAHLLGVATARYVLRVEPLASLDRERLVAIQAPVVQHHLTGDLG